MSKSSIAALILLVLAVVLFYLHGYFISVDAVDENLVLILGFIVSVMALGIAYNGINNKEVEEVKWATGIIGGVLGLWAGILKGLFSA